MSIFEMLKSWIDLYDGIGTFIVHKLIHIIVGLGVVLVFTELSYPIVGMLLCFAIAVVKEVTDRELNKIDKDIVTPGEWEKFKDDPYVYAAPIYAHVFDVIVTMLGGVAGLLLGIFL